MKRSSPRKNRLLNAWPAPEPPPPATWSVPVASDPIAAVTVRPTWKMFVV